MHLNAGYTRVMLERTIGVGLADGGITWDIPTDKIPAHLRPIGSRVLVTKRLFLPEEADSADEIRRSCQEVTVDDPAMP